MAGAEPLIYASGAVIYISVTSFYRPFKNLGNAVYDPVLTTLLE